MKRRKGEVLGKGEELSFRHVKFEKPEGNAKDCIDLSELTGMEVIA